jgi:PAS domain-containing protein
MGMLVTPGNGIMFLASFAFLAIGLVGWFSFKRPDLSAKLWLLGFVISGIAPILGAFGGETVGPWPFVSSSLALAASFVLFGLALKTLYSPGLPLREYVVTAGSSFIVYMVCLGYSVNSGSESAQIMLFALGNGLAAAWATHQAVQLNQRSRSPFVVHLIIIFGIQSALIFLRIPQAMVSDPSRLWEHDTFNEVILAVLSICGIIKAVSYFGLRFEEIRERLESETRVIREQAQKLAQKNAEIASAMHAVPIACVVTNPSLEVLYINAQAKRLLGSIGANETHQKLSDWMLGLQGVSQLSFAAARHMLLMSGSPTTAIATEISANGLESDSSSSQWVFLIKPVDFSDAVIESVWSGIPRADNRTWLICDRSGRVSSAQTAWGELLGAYAVFDMPELRFGGVSEPRDAREMNLWESLKQFSDDADKIERSRRELQAGKASALLLRDATGTQLSCGFVPVRRNAGEDDLWIVEVTCKQLRSTSATKTSPSKDTKAVKSDATIGTPPREPDVPEFLRRT